MIGHCKKLAIYLLIRAEQSVDIKDYSKRV